MTARWALPLVALLLNACQGLPSPAAPGPPDTATATPRAPERASGWTDKPLAFGRRDMVAAAHPLAVDAGVAVLAKGGSALDAAIAVQMVLTLVEPQSSGIGGGAFLLHFDKASGRISAYDGRETAPAGASPEQFLGPQGAPLPFLQAVDGGSSVGTPGLLRMLALAHREHGKLPWAPLFNDAIRLSEEGFPISPRLHGAIRAAAARMRAQGEPVASHFLGPDGQAKAAGSQLRNPALAQTLRRLADESAEAFYRGEIARAIVDKVRNHPTRPGALSLADLAQYTPRVRAPVCGDYRDFRICGMGPPSSGGIAVLQILGMLSHFDVATLRPDGDEALHLITEAMRLAYADRARYVADAEAVPVPLAGLLDADYLKQRAGLIDLRRTLGAAPAGVPKGAIAWGMDGSLPLPSTSHIAIVDAQGNAVSMTTTIENGFGSLQMVGGFLLNNQLTDFSFAPRDAQGRPIANALAPGKRPRSSMAPTLVFNRQGELEAVVGSPGGSQIIAYVVKTLIGLIDWRMDIQQAIALPNVSAQTSATTALERGSQLGAATEALQARGHSVVQTDLNSGLHGIVFNGLRGDGRAAALARDPRRGDWSGGADPRREGVARGTP